MWIFKYPQVFFNIEHIDTSSFFTSSRSPQRNIIEKYYSFSFDIHFVNFFQITLFLLTRSKIFHCNFPV